MSDTQRSGSAAEAGDVDAWLERLAALLPPGTLGEVGPAERSALLDLARIAAHRSQRWAAPITTYLVGIAYASLPRAERLARMWELVAHLEVEPEEG